MLLLNQVTWHGTERVIESLSCCCTSM